MQVFRWFLAAKLMCAKIPTRVALSTWREFTRRGVDTPDGVRQAGWDGIFAILDDGGYTRYDFSTATRRLAMAGELLGRYCGDLYVLREQSEGPRDMEARLMRLGKGIGPFTTNIFLREMRGPWPVPARVNPVKPG